MMIVNLAQPLSSVGNDFMAFCVYLHKDTFLGSYDIVFFPYDTVVAALLFLSMSAYAAMQ